MFKLVYSRSAIAGRMFPVLAGLLMATAGTLAAAQELELSPATGSLIESVETLTQGPIHEAFANPTDLDPTPGPVVMRQPPTDVQEEPPEYMPEDSTWISGYWMWDDERDDFIWITGVARKTPPGMRYVPGYWTEVDGGWQRVSGFWMSADAAALEYRQQPPASLESGPSSAAPADNYFWVPGSWNHYDTGFRWRSGYWSPYQPDWVWCPARWAWTPGGYVYLPGFWDHRLSFRGQIFAPIYFRQPLYQQPSFVYRPWCVIPTNNLFIHLWTRPSHCHYYFGNYYGSRYADIGFQPWCETRPRSRHYDPFLTYCNVHYRRQGVDFLGRVQDWHDYYDRHEDHRPPRTWQEQQQVARRDGPRAALETQLFARNLVEVAKRNDEPVRLSRLDRQTREALSEKTARLRELNTSRKQVEREAAGVVARLPRAAADRGTDRRADRDDDDSRDKRGSDRDRGAKREVPTIAESPPGIQRPTLKLPKEVAKIVVPSDSTSSPLAKARPSNADDSRGPTRGTGDISNTKRGNIGRRDPIPPPMSTTSQRDGQSRPKQPRIALPADAGDANPPVNLPKVELPGREAAANEGDAKAPTEAQPRGKPLVESRRPDVDTLDLPRSEPDRGPRGKTNLPRPARPEIQPENRPRLDTQQRPDVRTRPENRPETRTRLDAQPPRLENRSQVSPRSELPTGEQPRSRSTVEAPTEARTVRPETTVPRPNVVPRGNAEIRERSAPRESARPPRVELPSETRARSAPQPRSESRPPTVREDRSRESRSKSRERDDD